jgi:transcriptional regulator with XRE-family HTH domain
MLLANDTKRQGGPQLPTLLRLALQAAGFAHLPDLATAAGLRPNTLDAIRCGARRLTPAVRARIAAALRVDVAQVDEILFARLP